MICETAHRSPERPGGSAISERGDAQARERLATLLDLTLLGQRPVTEREVGAPDDLDAPSRELPEWISGEVVVDFVLEPAPPARERVDPGRDGRVHDPRQDDHGPPGRIPLDHTAPHRGADAHEPHLGRVLDPRPEPGWR